MRACVLSLFALLVGCALVGAATPATACIHIEEIRYLCYNPETGCDSEKLVAQCRPEGDHYCFHSTGSGECCGAIYNADSMVPGCGAKGPKPPQGKVRGAGRIELARVYVPSSCSSRYSAVTVAIR